MQKLICCGLALLMLLTACNNQQPETNNTTATTDAKHPAAQVVEDYLQARVSIDEAGLRASLCPEMESEVDIQLSSFKGRNASLKDLACTFDDEATVTCEGVIVTEYDGETGERPLSDFRVIEDDGTWKVCGEA